MAKKTRKQIFCQKPQKNDLKGTILVVILFQFQCPMPYIYIYIYIYIREIYPLRGRFMNISARTRGHFILSEGRRPEDKILNCLRVMTGYIHKLPEVCGRFPINIPWLPKKIITQRQNHKSTDDKLYLY